MTLEESVDFVHHVRLRVMVGFKMGFMFKKSRL